MRADVDTFRALARSAPWRWNEVSFTCRWPHDHWQTGQVEALVRRDGYLRVAAASGRLLTEQTQTTPAAPAVVVFAGDGVDDTEARRAAEAHRRGRLSPPDPEMRPDGLVARRFDGLQILDAPMYQTYHWVAMLDPRELADGSGDGAVSPWDESVPGVEVSEVRGLTHAGRAALEAVVRPTPDYEPRCGCCPLLPCETACALEEQAGGPACTHDHPDAYVVRLDVGTGICVLTRRPTGDPRRGTRWRSARRADALTAPAENHHRRRPPDYRPGVRPGRWVRGASRAPRRGRCPATA